MRVLSFLCLVAMSLIGPHDIADAQGVVRFGPVRFETVEIFIDSAEPFAAWQFELRDANSSMSIVGVENGESSAFRQAPYFDRDAVQAGTAERIIVADFSLADENELPVGRTRVATLHVMLSGQRSPQYDLKLIAVTAADGNAIDASISLQANTNTGSQS